MSPLPSFRRSMLLHLLDASFNLGYRPAVSADVSAKYATDSDGKPGGPFNSRLYKSHKYSATWIRSKAIRPTYFPMSLTTSD